MARIVTKNRKSPDNFQRMTIMGVAGGTVYVSTAGLYRQSGTNQGLRILNKSNQGTVDVSYTMENAARAAPIKGTPDASVDWVSLVSAMAANAAYVDTTYVIATALKIVFSATAGSYCVEIVCN